jgi:hypothetical protein
VRSGNPPATWRGRRWLTPLLAAIGLGLLSQSTAGAQSDHHYRAEDVQNDYTLYQWKAALGGPTVMGPIAYQVDDKQYVAVIAGNVLVSFALPDCTGGKPCT